MLIRNLVFALALSTHAGAQSHLPVTLLQVGDSVPGTGALLADFDGSTRFRAGGGGGWVARVTLDVADPATDGVLLRDGLSVFREGNPVAVPAGGSVAEVLGCDLDGEGNAFYSLRIAGYPAPTPERLSVFRNAQRVLTELDPCLAPAFGAGSYYASVHQFWAAGAGRFWVRGEVVDPGLGPAPLDVLILVALDAAGTRIAETLIVGEGDPLGSAGDPVEELLELEAGGPADPTGTSAFLARLAAPIGSGDVVAYAADTLVAESGAPSLVPGRDWGSLYFSAIDTNSAGSYAALLQLDISDIDSDEVLVVDGVLRAREGEPGPISGSLWDDLKDSGLRLDEQGRVFFSSTLDGLPVGEDKVLVRDGELLVRSGYSQVEGRLLTDLDQERRRMDASKNGRFLLFTGELDGADSALMQLQLDLGSTYCGAELNSTGEFASLGAVGSTEAARNLLVLRCTSLPLNRPVLLVTSETEGDVLGAGGGQGRLCLSGSIARFKTLIQNSGNNGRATFQPDLAAIPLTPAVAVLPGQTWNFQAWYRDQNPGLTSNLSLPLKLEFR